MYNTPLIVSWKITEKEFGVTNNTASIVSFFPLLYIDLFIIVIFGFKNSFTYRT